MKNKLLRSVCFFLIVILFSSCASRQDIKTETTVEKLKIITTISPLFTFAENLAQDKAEIHNLVPYGAGIHTWQPSASDLKRIAKADIIIKNGLNLEEFLNDLITNSENPDLLIVDTSEGITTYDSPEMLHLEEGDEREDEDEHGHEGLDPHIWLSPENAKIQIANIAQALQTKDPENKEFYEENKKAYLQQLSTLQQKIKENLNNVEKQKFIVFHDAYQYYLREFDLIQYAAAAIEEFPGKEPSPAYLHELMRLIDEQDIRIIFTEPQFSPKIVEMIQAEKENIKTYELDPIGSHMMAWSYEDNLNNITDTLVQAFSSYSK